MINKKLLLIPMVAVVVIGLLLAGCPKAAPPPAKPEEPYGTITSAIPDFGFEATDPVFYESLWGWAYYDSLIRWDKNGKFIPHVAEDWWLDGNVWTFKIRPGIKFHNGDPLTAHDVKFSVDRFGDMTLSKNPWSYYISELYNKVETRVLDDYTFQFVSARPEPAQQIVFAWTRILPKNYFESVGQDEFRKHPIGSGPWKFKELISKTKLVLEANTDYWIKEEVPHYQYFVELMVPEQATRIAMLKNGEVDMAAVDYDRIPDLVKEGFATINLGPPGTSSICIQGSWLPSAGPVHDIRIRQALSYALNRQEIADTWYQGYARPGGQFYMYPGCFGWSDKLAADPYDPEKAKALIKEAGYPQKFADPTIHVYTTAPGQDYHLLIIDYWKKVGLDVKLEVVDSTIYTSYFFNFNRLKEGDPNVGWIFTWTYTAFFNCMYHSANMYTSWGTHNVGNDPKADELYLRAANEIDPDLAYQYFAEFQEYVKTLYVNIGIVEYDVLVLYNPKTLGEFAGRNWVSNYDALNGIKHPE